MRCPKCSYENKNNAIVCSMCKEPLVPSGRKMSDEEYTYGRILSIPPSKFKISLFHTIKGVFLLIILLGLTYVYFFVNASVKERYFLKFNRYVDRFFFGEEPSTEITSALSYEETDLLKGRRECKNRLFEIARDIGAYKSIDNIVLESDPVCPENEEVQYKFTGALGDSFSIYCKFHNQTCVYDKENKEIIFED